MTYVFYAVSLRFSSFMDEVSWSVVGTGVTLSADPDFSGRGPGVVVAEEVLTGSDSFFFDCKASAYVLFIGRLRFGRIIFFDCK